METAEKREKIASCIVNLKKGLKRMRRQDIDEAIQLLLLYDGDLKRFAKMPVKPIEKQGLKYADDYNSVVSNRSIGVSMTVVAINENGKSVAWPLVRTTETTVAKMVAGEIEPIAEVQIDNWMKEHVANEMSFLSVYASIITGHLEVKQEDIVTADSEVFLYHKDVKADPTNIKYRVTKVTSNKVWLDRGFIKSMFPVKRTDVIPVKKTEVKQFIMEKWEL